MITYDDDNLAKHGITRQEVDQVLDSRNLTTRVFELQPSRQGNSRVMYVGFTLQAPLLEVGVEYLEESDHVFHADDATKAYRKEFD